MRTLRMIKEALADLRAATRSEVIADKIWLYLLRLHRPEDAGEEGAPRPYCLRCGTDWPCKEFDRIDAEREKAHS